MEDGLNKVTFLSILICIWLLFWVDSGFLSDFGIIKVSFSDIELREVEVTFRELIATADEEEKRAEKKKSRRWLAFDKWSESQFSPIIWYMAILFTMDFFIGHRQKRKKNYPEAGEKEKIE